MKRRTFLAAGLAGAAVAGFALRPRNQGGEYSAYFATLNQELRSNGPVQPLMLLDLDRLDINIKVLRDALGGKYFRIVAKSLPSLQLIEYVMEQADTKRAMLFHQPFINALVKKRPDADILLGKPMPVRAAAACYKGLAKTPKFKHEAQLQWLIDTPERLSEYLALAQAQQLRMNINIEIDVGLHRGGVADAATFSRMLALIAANPQHLRFSGLMGYDPHVVKVPSIIASVDELHQQALSSYQAFQQQIQDEQPQLLGPNMTWNAAGSPTYRLYENVANDVISEVSVGSALVKPTDFDLDILQAHVPAAYIATPVLKQMDSLQVPGIEKFSPYLAYWDPNQQQSYFIYGGYWKAKPENPPGLQINSLYGRSTNQEMLNGSRRVGMSVGDYAFLRPTQSEFVFLQFGDLVAVRQGKIVDYWPVLS